MINEVLSFAFQGRRAKAMSAIFCVLCLPKCVKEMVTYCREEGSSQIRERFRALKCAAGILHEALIIYK